MKNNFERCAKCILSSSFPDIEFDEDGICSFCRDKMFFTAEDKRIEAAKKQIQNLFESKKNIAEYDAVMCYSGGKDSTYALMLAVQKYKLKVLSLTLDNSFISSVAFENINRVVDYLGVDQITIKPSIKFMKSLIKASTFNKIYNPKTLVRISANCNSCISIVNITALRFALEKKAPFILAGFTLGQIPLNSIIFKNNYRFLQESREPSLNKLRKLIGHSVDNYLCIKDSILGGVESYPYNINLLCIENITEEEIFKQVKSIGWLPPGDVDGCSSNCLLNIFNNYVHEKSLGYNPYELELSHLIRKGWLSREEALNKLKDQPAGYIKSIMDKLEITDQEMQMLSHLYK